VLQLATKTASSLAGSYYDDLNKQNICLINHLIAASDKSEILNSVLTSAAGVCILSYLELSCVTLASQLEENLRQQKDEKGEHAKARAGAVVAYYSSKLAHSSILRHH
jgi:hypothetical protein